MIRRLEPDDLPAAAELWLDANREAHGFLPASYWLEHLEEVQAAMAQAEMWAFAAEEQAEILGFIGLQGDYVAGLFVRREARSGGVGRQLLDHAKAGRQALRLRVYQKNKRAAAFYRREGFRALEADTDPDTGEVELLLEWRRPGPEG